MGMLKDYIIKCVSNYIDKQYVDETKTEIRNHILSVIKEESTREAQRIRGALEDGFKQMLNSKRWGVVKTEGRSQTISCVNELREWVDKSVEFAVSEQLEREYSNKLQDKDFILKLVKEINKYQLKKRD